MPLPVSVGALRKLVKEVQVSARAENPLAVGGARELASVLRRELGRDAKPGAVRADDEPRGAAVLVYVLAREPSAEDEQALKRARRARVPIVAVAVGRVAEDVSIPFVLATDVVRIGAGEGFPVEKIAQVVAARLGEEGAALAARLPVLRRAVCRQLVASFARKNGIFAAAAFVPGVDLPVLALNQVRMLLRLEQAYGLEIDARRRAPELLATVAAGLGLRAVARELLAAVPVAGWAVKGAIAYGGTRALGEAAVRRLEAGVPGGDGGLSTRPRA
ncbi:MAG TPA: hypothetical protein VNY33_06545 [Gaiellaceae bacterium]|jgi:uncharacterized protein (DUF697 family)|nr:hypothetical protein [Gaiellaceae bacterium]